MSSGMRNVQLAMSNARRIAVTIEAEFVYVSPDITMPGRFRKVLPDMLSSETIGPALDHQHWVTVKMCS